MNKRLSASECMKHKWFNILLNSKSEKIDSKILNNLSKMNDKNKIQSAVFTFIVGFLISEEDKSQLKKLFYESDTDNSG